MTTTATGKARSGRITSLRDSLIADGVAVSDRALDRFAMAHDASHYLAIPQLVATPTSESEVGRLLVAAAAHETPVTFRSGGTSLSGQAVTGELLADTRRHFRHVEVEQSGQVLAAGPGATAEYANRRLSRYRRKLGPDPASTTACTIGGIVANNSSGMCCGIAYNSYRTIRSLRLVLPSGAILDTGAPEADDELRRTEPDLHSGLLRLRERLLASPESVATVQRLFGMKNTMGYGVNALLDFERAVDILTHIIVGSEGTLAFVSEARFDTVEVLPEVSTGLLIFDDLESATAALPDLIGVGFAAIELMDAGSLRVAQTASDAPADLAALVVDRQAALLVELQAAERVQLEESERRANTLLPRLPLSAIATMTTDPIRRAALWNIRKGLYTAVAGNRPSGTTALLEDIAVPVEQLNATCERLTVLFDRHGYEGSVIFGHAKDGNIHFMLNESFDDLGKIQRYRRFTEDLVDLVLEHGGTLKAEHGTGRIMAPFVRRQYGDELYELMWDIKRLFDPDGVLNPGILLTEDADSYVRDLKVVPRVEAEVDRCVECGFCEPVCPSRDLTLTPRQRIVVRREIAAAEAVGDAGKASDLRRDYEYAGIETCAADGLCQISCPVDINTGDLVRRLRAEDAGRLAAAGWRAAATNWSLATGVGRRSLAAAAKVPSAIPIAVTRGARAILGHGVVPLYDPALPAGGDRRQARPGTETETETANDDFVFFSACISSMFGPEPESLGVGAALFALAERAGLTPAIPHGIDSLCCGTPWKSKGYGGGYAAMSAKVLPRLLAASGDGRLPIVCDAASCTEGLRGMLGTAAESAVYKDLQIFDATQFVQDVLMPRLPPPRKVRTLVLHHTCATTALGANGALSAIAEAIAHNVIVPAEWGCCAFAGDRGLLYPELTASATAAETTGLAAIDADCYVSANRTCEIGMTRATGKPYRHILEALEEATRR
jgi:D-lactate dehydrogenase